MPKITVGSFSMSAATKKQLLEYIDENLDRFYKFQWNQNRFSYNVLNEINDKYFNKEFKMTRSEAAEELEKISNYTNPPYLHAKFKLNWFLKFVPIEEEKKERQTTIDDFMEAQK